MPREEVYKPATETEHLMMTHGDMPDLTQHHSDAVLAAINKLPAKERKLIEAMFFERASYRQLGERLDVNHVNAWRQVRRILKKLEKTLSNDPTIQRRYNIARPDDMG